MSSHVSECGLELSDGICIVDEQPCHHPTLFEQDQCFRKKFAIRQSSEDLISAALNLKAPHLQSEKDLYLSPEEEKKRLQNIVASKEKLKNLKIL